MAGEIAQIGRTLLDFLPSGIDKECLFVKSVFSDGGEGGALAQFFADLKARGDYVSQGARIEDFSGLELNLLARLFCGLSRDLLESDARLARRTRAWCARGGDETWGTEQDVRRAVQIYFGNPAVYTAIDANDEAEDVLDDGDFEDDADETPWDFSGGAALSAEARFSGRQGAALGAGGSASQAVDLAAGIWALHFFHEGAVEVSIHDAAAGKWFECDLNAAERKFDWKSEPCAMQFAAARDGGWKNGLLLFRCDGPAAIEIKFEGGGDGAKVDRAQLFPHIPQPTGKIILHYEGWIARADTMHAAEGGEDGDETGIDYKKASYFENSFFTGLRGAIFVEKLTRFLSEIAPFGVKIFVERLVKEEAG